ncbi:porin [Massilia suwonensis]|uniref:Porin n=1 Tax=Massilia suwonensis TaxID=648895 RepID=A0ABW0MPT1_9BURK
MKKARIQLGPQFGLFALGLLGAAAAQAQTNVTIYGIMDAALVVEDGGTAGRTTKITSGAASASRIGFRGTEDLGNGLSAFFTLETGAKIDTGTLDANNTIFNRQALVGLKGKAGAVALGRQYTPWHNALAQVGDPFSTGYAGSSKNVFADNGANVRSSNTITYAFPNVNGAWFELAYALGEGASSADGRQYGGAIGYARGPLNARLAYNSKNAETPQPGGRRGRNTLLAANYDLKFIKLYGAFNVDKGFNAAPLGNPNNPYGGVRPTASTDGREVLLGLSAPVPGGTLLASVMHKDDRTAFNQDANAWGVGYLYPLSKRTNLYAAYGHIDNRNGAGYTVANNTESGTGDTGYNLGIRHTF